MPSFEQIVTCNYCNESPAAGWITEEQDGEQVARSACLLCANEEGAVMDGKVTASAEL